MKAKLLRRVPTHRAHHVCDITLDWLRANRVTRLVLDLDNTTVGWGLDVMDERVFAWLQHLQKNGIRVIIFTNNFRCKRIAKLQRERGLIIIAAHCNPLFWKPRPWGIRHAGNLIGAKPESTLVVDDQLSGVEAGTKAGYRTLLVDPLTNRDAWYTTIRKRPKQTKDLATMAKYGCLPTHLPRQSERV